MFRRSHSQVQPVLHSVSYIQGILACGRTLRMLSMIFNHPTFQSACHKASSAFVSIRPTAQCHSSLLEAIKEMVWYRCDVFHD